MFISLSKGAGSAGPSLGAALGALDAVLSPGAARAREELEAQHQLVVATPSPGDRLLDEGRIVIRPTSPSEHGAER